MYKTAQLPKPGGVAGHGCNVFLASLQMVHETCSTRYPMPEFLRPHTKEPYEPLISEEYPQVPAAPCDDSAVVEVPCDAAAVAAANETVVGVGRSPSVASTVALGADASMGTPSLPLQSTPSVPTPDTMHTGPSRRLAAEEELESARAEVTMLGRRLHAMQKDKEVSDEKAIETAMALVSREEQLLRA